jgi:hypothetical protein
VRATSEPSIAGLKSRADAADPYRMTINGAQRILSVSAAAAFAWVLAQPPLLAGGVIGAGSPIEQWTVTGRFSSRESCDMQRGRNNSGLFTTLAEYAPNPASREQATMLAAASRCIEAPMDDDQQSP